MADRGDLLDLLLPVLELGGSPAACPEYMQELVSEIHRSGRPVVFRALPGKKVPGTWDNLAPAGNSPFYPEMTEEKGSTCCRQGTPGRFQTGGGVHFPGTSLVNPGGNPPAGLPGPSTRGNRLHRTCRKLSARIIPAPCGWNLNIISATCALNWEMISRIPGLSRPGAEWGITWMRK